MIATSLPWTLNADGSRTCARHAVTFGRLATCTACDADPGPPIDATPPPEVDHHARADEAFARARRDELLALATDTIAELPLGTLRADGKAHSTLTDEIKGVGLKVSSIIKAYEAAAKWHRIAVEERRLVDARDHDRWLVQQKRELDARGGAH